MKKHLLYKLFFVFIATILLLFPVMAFSQSPVPDIKINNSDGPLSFIPSEENLSVSVQLDAAGRTDHADWFLAGNTSLGLFFYNLYSWTDVVTPAVQTVLQPVPSFHLMDIPLSSLWPGDYTLYFGVDTKMDGAITWDQLYFDAVGFTIENLPYERRFIEASTGGTLIVANQRGDEITLEIPPGSLKASQTITMTALDTAVSSPFANKLLPGVLLSPQGTQLQKPARLKVKFSTSLTEPKSAVLLLVEGPQLAWPLGDRYYKLNELEGDIYHFSTIEAVAMTSEIEILNVLQAINAQAAVVKKENGMNDITANVKGRLEYAAQLQLLGSDESALKTLQDAKSIASRDCADFLAQSMPQDPQVLCNSYTKSFLEQFMLVQLLGLEQCNNTTHGFSYEYLDDHLLNLDKQCDILDAFTGTWKVRLRPNSGECQFLEITPYDCREIIGYPIEPSDCMPANEEVMMVEIFPTAYGHAIRFPERTVLNQAKGHFPSDQTYPLTINGRDFFFEYKTNSTPWCKQFEILSPNHGDAVLIGCSEEGKVTGNISEDGTKLMGSKGWYEWDEVIVQQRVWPIDCKIYDDPPLGTSWPMINYLSPKRLYQTGIFSGAKQ